jgi:threonine/homoserine/homoserine lactone efflux protein
MSWSAYWAFIAFAAVLVLMPGPDFAVVTRNTLTGGGRRGAWSALGVFSSNLVQGTAAVAGLGALITRSQPVFQAIKWAGIGYLVFLGLQALRSAWLGRHSPLACAAASGHGQGLAGWRQGFLSNITNPKVLVFYLAVLPQFLGATAPIVVMLAFAVSHALLSVAYLLLVVGSLHRVRRLLARRAVRRGLDTVTGTALLGFGGKLALEQA